MTTWEQIRLVELPLAVPIIMAGVRTSTIYLIGWTTLAAFIGGGGLGDYILIGLQLYQPEYIIAGAIPVTIFSGHHRLYLDEAGEKSNTRRLKRIEGSFIRSWLM